MENDALDRDKLVLFEYACDMPRIKGLSLVYGGSALTLCNLHMLYGVYERDILYCVAFLKRVKKIEYGAFKSCTSPTNVHLPDGVEKIGCGAFADCTALKGGIRKTVTRRVNKWQTVRQIWEKQVLQLGIAGHLLYCCLMLPARVTLAVGKSYIEILHIVFHLIV